MKTTYKLLFFSLFILITLLHSQLQAQCLTCGNGTESVILNDINSNQADADYSISGGFNVTLDNSAFNSFGFGSELFIEDEETFLLGWNGEEVFRASVSGVVVTTPFNVRNTADFDHSVNIDYNLTVGNNHTIGNDLFVNRDGNITRNLQISNNLTVNQKSFLMGNVGIGNTNPQHKLDVVGNIRTNSNLFATKIGVGTITPQASIEIAATTGIGGLLISTQSTDAPCPDPPCGYLTTPYALKATHTDGTQGMPTPIETFWVKGSGESAFKGKMSLGTTSLAPTAMLDIHAGNNAGITVRTENQINDYGYSITSVVGKETTKALVVQYDDGSNPITEPFFVNGNGEVNLTRIKMDGLTYMDQTQGLVLNNKKLLLRGATDQNHFLGWFGGTSAFASEYPDGPVLAGFTGGILGTTYNGEKAVLQWHNSGKVAINGTLYVEEVMVMVDPLTQIPDYVFEKDYKRMSLPELEVYVNTNKHLPGIPSAKEVEEAGHIDMGEMQLNLLEKVEELTLYVIELNNKVQELEKENGELRK